MSPEPILAPASVRLGLSPTSKEDAIRYCGQILVDAGAADPAYVDGMLAREKQISTYLGEGVAIPHGTNESRGHITRAALGFAQFPAGIDWDGKRAYVLIPIASATDEHVSILASLAEVLMDSDSAERLRTTSSVDEVLTLLAPQAD
ncbi:MAG: PTS sugar transporter subunit IIA [Actinobacteria bacterium]|nr:PTS sugar transporter subunit IIA [Actinomycetota bacterium]